MGNREASNTAVDPRETVYVIPPYPHKWWEREEIEEGVLVMLGWPEGDDRIWRVTGVWGEGASLAEEKRGL